MVRKILEKVDKAKAEAYCEDDIRKGVLKAGAAGFVEGFIDGICVLGFITWLIYIIAIIKHFLKK